MPDDAAELSVLELALPYLGSFATVPRRLRPQQDAEHPGHTFDFVGRRLDGGSVAIEVTSATYETWQGDGAIHLEVEASVTRDLREAGAVPGTYHLSTTRRSPRMKQLRDRIVAAALKLEVDEQREIASDTWLYRDHRSDGEIKFYWAPSAGGDLLQEHRLLFGDALTDCRQKLAAASNAGFESHLLIEPFPIGTRQTWRGAFDLLAAEGTLDSYPAVVWVVSISDERVQRMH